MPEYFEIAVNVPGVAGVFDYHVPAELEGCIVPGQIVEVPFGKQRVQGVVLRQVDKPAVPETRAVQRIIDPNIVLPGRLLSLAFLLARDWFSPLNEWISLMLPPGLGKLSDTCYKLGSTVFDAQKFPNKLQQRLVGLIQMRGELRGRQIDGLLPRTNWRPSAQALARRGVLNSEAVLLQPGVQPRRLRTVQLSSSTELSEQTLKLLGRAGSPTQARRKAVLELLKQETGPVQVSWVYAGSGATSIDLRKLAELGLIQLGDNETWRDPLENFGFIPDQPPELTSDQARCWGAIEQALFTVLRSGGEADAELPAPFLLFGVTGSGKTELYLRAVEQTLQAGRQALILVPEISLTPQMTQRFMARFTGQVGLTHSNLSTGERYDTWRRANQGAINIVIGPRSALFTPFQRLGLIVLDECHDESYYQDDPPVFHAVDVAVRYAELSRAVVLMGSATPNVTQTYRADKHFPSQSGRKWQLLELPRRIMAHRQEVEAQVKQLGRHLRFASMEKDALTLELPDVHVVDMRQELKNGNRSIFSAELQSGIQHVLDKKQQAILFLNRRGLATYVFCRDCGSSLKCPHCDIPLTCHTRPGGAAAEVLVCHHCAYQRKMPATCPKCGSKRIRQYGTGTERVDQEVLALFPAARSLRWDYETTRHKGAHDAILRQFTSRGADGAPEVDLLIGTQMLAKGLDLPLVTLVGVVLADVGLNLPDYRAAERSFQVLAQVAGRAGRSLLGGEVVLQTFQPEHYVIKAAAAHDYRSFYKQEIAYRRELRYPPFSRLLRMEYRQLNNARAEEETRRMAEMLRSRIVSEQRSATDFIGPVPCFYHRLGGYYRWQIVLRGPEPQSLLASLVTRLPSARLPDGWRVQIDPLNLL